MSGCESCMMMLESKGCRYTEFNCQSPQTSPAMGEGRRLSGFESKESGVAEERCAPYGWGAKMMISPLLFGVVGLCLLGWMQHTAVASDIVWVTCGSTIKLAHSNTEARLHSHGVAYSRGSQQQSVTGYPESENAQSYWIVHGAVDAPCAPGRPIKKQQLIRLQHAATRKWLHSHQFYSPISGNQEISAFGDDSSSDGGDVWLVEWDSKAKHWKQDAKVRLKHKDTNMYLTSNKDWRFGQPIQGQQEVCGVPSSSKDTQWYAAEGVYLPRTDAKKKQQGKGNGDKDKDEL